MSASTLPPFASQAALRITATAKLTGALAHRLISGPRHSKQGRQAIYYRALWTEAAAHVGGVVRTLDDGRLEIAVGQSRVRVRGTHCSIDGREALQRAGDKVLVHELLAEAGLPTPEYCTFSLAKFDQARQFLADAPGDCVVKPGQDSAGGRGVTTRVRRPRDLVRAAAVAAHAGARSSRGRRSSGRVRRLANMYGQLGAVPLLIEHQIVGSNYRLLYLDGELIDAIRRGTPTVLGDGVSSVAQLLERLNGDRLRAGGVSEQSLVSADLDCERTLADQGLTVSSVPAAGVEVRIKTTINEGAAHTNRPARDELCSAIVKDGARAAEIVGVRWAGVDVITANPAVPLEESGGRILEVNTTPGLHMHQHGRPGEVEPAKVLLERLFRSSHGGPPHGEGLG